MYQPLLLNAFGHEINCVVSRQYSYDEKGNNPYSCIRIITSIKAPLSVLGLHIKVKTTPSPGETLTTATSVHHSNLRRYRHLGKGFLSDVSGTTHRSVFSPLSITSV